MSLSVEANEKTKLQEVSVRFDSMAFGGKAVARHQGMVVFCEGAVEGDVARVRLVAQSKRYADAEIIEITKHAEYKIASDCKFFGICGGCSYLQVPYEKQIEWKKNFVLSALQRIGKLNPETTIHVHRSTQEKTYRNRIHLKGRVFLDGSVRVGYFRRSTNEITIIDNCMIADPTMQHFFDFIQTLKLLTSTLLKFKCEVQVLQRNHSSDCESGLAISFMCDHHDEKARQAVEKIILACQSQAWCIWAGWYEDAFKCDYLPFDSDQGINWYSKPSLFQQVNIKTNRILRKVVKDRIGPESKRILDVCSGSGNLSLALRTSGRYIEGVESNELSVACARYNSDMNPLEGEDGPNYIVGDATKHLWKCARRGEEFDTVILDPPRAGMYEGMIPLAKIAPKKVLYISCDPANLARDLGSLCKNGYKISSLDIFDFFPQTYHVETLAELIRDDQ